jgi:ribosomal protein L15
VYTGQLSTVKGATVDAHTLFEAGLIATPFHTVKLISRGEYTGKANVKLTSASAGAIAQLEKAGGSFEAVSVPKLPASNKERAEKRSEKAEKKSK